MTPKGWLALLALGALIAAGVVWGFLGQIPETVTGKGYLLRSGGVQTVKSLIAGQIVEVHFDVGETVQENQVIARVLEEGQIAATPVRSPYAGTVLEVQVGEGDFVSPETPILSLESGGQNAQDLIAVIYVSPVEGKKVEKGMTVHVIPATVHKEDAGYILGKIRSCSEFPVTYQSMLLSLGSEAFAQEILAQNDNQAQIQIYVDLVIDRDGLRWIPQRDVPIKVSNGTLCSVDIILDSKRPVDLIFQARQ